MNPGAAPATRGRWRLGRRRGGRLRRSDGVGTLVHQAGAAQELAEAVERDVAPGEHDRDAIALAQRDRPRQDGRERRRPGRLDHLLRALEREAQPLEDRRVVDRDVAREVAARDVERQVARRRRVEPVGDADRRDAHGLARGEPLVERIRARRLDAVDPDPRPRLAQGDGDPADQAATAHGDHDDVDLGQVLEQLEAARPVAQQDLRVVVGMDEDEAAFLAQPLEVLERLADVRAVQDDLGAVLAARVHLRLDRGERHDDRHRHARLAAGPRVGLSGVAGRDRDRAAGPLVRREGGDPGQRGARLERAGLLEVLGLQVEPVVGDADARPLADHPRRRRGREQRRAMDPSLEGRAGRADGVEGDRRRAHAASMPGPRPSVGPPQRDWLSMQFAFLRKQ